MKTGDKVMIRFDRRNVVGEIELASNNERSLMLKFETILGNYVGRMPVLMNDQGQYEDLIDRKLVIVERMS